VKTIFFHRIGKRDLHEKLRNALFVLLQNVAKDNFSDLNWHLMLKLLQTNEVENNLKRKTFNPTSRSDSLFSLIA
jgi:hypothetical protein